MRIDRLFIQQNGELEILHHRNSAQQNASEHSGGASSANSSLVPTSSITERDALDRSIMNIDENRMQRL